MNSTILLAIAPIVCGFGQYPVTDFYGNEICRQAATGETRKIESLDGRCPIGSYPNLTIRGAGCTQPGGRTYYPDRHVCPNGTTRKLDQYGNEVCQLP